MSEDLASRPGMLHTCSSALSAAAAYEAALGSARSCGSALDAGGEFPLLISGTALPCGVGYSVTGKFWIPALSPAELERATSNLFGDLAILLASLCPVTLFMGVILAHSDAGPLGEYDPFLRLNIIFVAVGGALAMARQWTRLLSVSDASSSRAITTLCVWVALSALAGGQVAFYMRPLFGMPLSRGEDRPFTPGSEPTLRGARQFFEVTWSSDAPPELVPDGDAPRADRARDRKW